MLNIFHMPPKVKAQKHTTSSARPHCLADLCVNTAQYSKDVIMKRPCSTCRNPAQKMGWLYLLADNKCQECDLVVDSMALKHTWSTPEQWHSWSGPRSCLMLNSAVDSSVSSSWCWQLKPQFGDLRMIPDSEDSSPIDPAAWILWGSRSADQLRFLPGFSECQRPHRWWLTGDDTCWLQVKSRLVQNRTWLTFCFTCRFFSLLSLLLFSLLTFLYHLLDFL